MAAKIVTRGLVKKFGKNLAVNRINFSSTDGVNIILGPNGAGKSTLIKCIDGLYRPDSGTVRVMGKDPYTDNDLKMQMSLLTDNYALYDYLSVMNNMKFFGRLYGMRDSDVEERTRELLKELDAVEYMNQKVGELSRGTKQKVSFCRALLSDPEILLFDEPTAFLDAHAAQSVRNIMLRYAKEGRTILFVTQKIDEVTRYNARIMVIRKGRLAKETDTSRLYREIIKGSLINVRVAEPMGLKIARKIPFFVDSNDEKATLLKFKVDGYKDINEILAEISKKGGYVVSVDYTEPFIEDFSIK